MASVATRSAPMAADRRKPRQAGALVGREVPRIWTPPLRRLGRGTSRGFEVCDFAASLGVSLLPWQRWALIHGLELAVGGGYRFRTVVLTVSRQNGKTTLSKLLALWRMSTDPGTVVLGTSTNLEYARDAFEACAELAEDTMGDAVAKVKRGALDTSLTLTNRSRYRVAAANRRGGRSLSVDLALLDELREHASWDAWAAASGATTAKPDHQIWCLSNAGDDTSVVLNSHRESGLAWIEEGVGDGTLALFEWSGPEGCELDDRQAWAASNPALGYTITEATLQAKLDSSPPAVFRTEHLCQRVRLLDPAIDPGDWAACLEVGTLDGARDRVALCLDLSPDLLHATLVAAARLDDGRVRVEVVRAWEGERCTADLRRELGPLIARVKPRALGWMPLGPAAALTADLAERKGRAGWPPRGVTVEPIRSELTAVAMGFAEAVASRLVAHSGDPLLDAHVGGAQRLKRGDAWVFSRGGEAHVDAAYAAAGAVHLARTAPAKLGKPRVIVAIDG